MTRKWDAATVRTVFPLSEVHVRPHRPNPRGTAVTVITGVINVLHIDGVEHAAPGMPVVVALDNIFAAIVQIAIAEQKAESAQLQIFLVVGFDGVGYKCDTDLVDRAMPALPA